MRAGADDAGDDRVVDLLGIGFGPSNLALAVAVEEWNQRCGEAVTCAFVERQPRFGWHRGMLLEGATMQVSFLKDLVTMRNPASDFSFLSYLQERDRLADFVNHKVLFPLRIEFHDYLEWAAARVGHLVAYGRQVTEVRPVVDGDQVVAFDVVTADADGGAVDVRRARNVAVAVGLTPRMPPGVAAGPRVWHTRDLLPRVAEVVESGAEPQRYVVVGSGQSAAEAVDFLHRRFPTAEVCSVFARYGYAPSDDTPFANRIFDPDAVDVYFGADDDVKRMLFDYHRNTNYSVVDADLIEELYRRSYQEKVQGRTRLRMLNASRVVAVEPGAEAVQVEVESLPTGERAALRADAVVYATGYEPGDVLRLLGPAGELVRRRPDGAPEVGRDYRLALEGPATAGVYLQGGTEHSHGISSSLLSNIAVRTGEIVESVAGRLPAARAATSRRDEVVAAAR